MSFPTLVDTTNGWLWTFSDIFERLVSCLAAGTAFSSLEIKNKEQKRLKFLVQ